MATIIVPREEAAAPDWARKYPPLLGIFVALLIAVAVLPSSLNLPQTNPTQTLEYAPVPPDQKSDDTPPQGNLSALGLGRSSSLNTGGAPGGTGDGSAPGGPAAGLLAPPPPPPGPGPLTGGKGATPTQKRCVEGRQTEDPNSPPCVTYFSGDNFGATYQGVSGDETRLLVYIDGNVSETGGSQARADRPTEKYYDLFKDPDPNDPGEDHLIVKGMRVWQRYFNERFQTYGRRVHFFLYFTGFAQEPENRRADAADNYLKVKPFAVLSYANTNEIDYLQAMAKRGVLNFGAAYGRPNTFFQQFPKLVWGFQPTIEQQVDQYSSYVCQKVAGKASVLNGNSDRIPGNDNGKPRTFGIIHTTDPGQPGLIQLADQVTQRIKACGVTVGDTYTFTKCCFAQDVQGENTDTSQQMATAQSKGLTTLLWLGGLQGNYGRSAQAIGYQPEWIVLGDGLLDGNNPIRLSNNVAAFDRHSIIVTPVVFQPAIEQQRCAQAFREVDQAYPGTDLGFICEYYDNLFQIFTGIQVAGPRLGPTSVDKGYHAIPQRPSGSATLAACFYKLNDYTCVKDAQAEYYDASGQAPGDSRPGCWRSIGVADGSNPSRSANRSLPDQWDGKNAGTEITGREPCNGHNVGALLRTSPTG